MHKILHIAPMNYAGVPYSFFDMHLKCGDYSRIITFHRNERDFPEDICLNWPLPRFKMASLWRKRKVSMREATLSGAAPEFKPRNMFESLYFSFTDMLRKGAVKKLIKEYGLEDFEIIHYDTGLDFFRNSAQAQEWKKKGKKIVCCYYGSDLRTRGIIKELDKISDLNITSEYDHLALKKDLHYIFYPYDASELPEMNNSENEAVTIVHSPTNRKYKGTDLIVSVIERIKKERKINFLLLENMPRREVLELKSRSDISIDQVGGTMGGTGYGKAGLETIGIGIPTVTNMTPEYEKWLPENPFVVANNEEELYRKLSELIESKDLREEIGRKGKVWLKKYHGYESVNRSLYELYREKNIV